MGNNVEAGTDLRYPRTLIYTCKYKEHRENTESIGQSHFGRR